MLIYPSAHPRPSSSSTFPNTSPSSSSTFPNTSPSSSSICLQTLHPPTLLPFLIPLTPLLIFLSLHPPFLLLVHTTATFLLFYLNTTSSLSFFYLSSQPLSSCSSTCPLTLQPPLLLSTPLTFTALLFYLYNNPPSSSSISSHSPHTHTSFSSTFPNTFYHPATCPHILLPLPLLAIPTSSSLLLSCCLTTHYYPYSLSISPHTLLPPLKGPRPLVLKVLARMVICIKQVKDKCSEKVATMKYIHIENMYCSSCKLTQDDR
jgi:hypothetical protein